MAIAQRGSATTATVATGSLTLACNKPTGVVSGDVLIAQVTCNDSTVTGPSGWTKFDDQVAGTAGTDHFETTWWSKVAGGSEASSYTWTKAGGSVDSPIVITVTAWSGVDNTTPVQASNSVGYNTNQSEPLTTGTVTSSGTTLTLYGRGCRVTSSPSTLLTYTASGVTELSDVGIFSGGTISYSHAMYKATSESTGNAVALDITASKSETHTTTMVLTLLDATQGTDAPAGEAVGSATAYGPTVTKASSPAAGEADATATAYSPTVSVRVPAGTAAVAATANGPTLTNISHPAAGTAAATATAYSPTVTKASAPPAGTCAVTATANGPTLTETSSPAAGTAAATATAYGPKIAVGISAGTATATATANGPKVAVATPSGTAVTTATAYNIASLIVVKNPLMVSQKSIVRATRW